MELKNRIIQQKPRENSGTSSSNRFDYQQDWAICKLLELHQSGSDYLLILDYHDDVVVLNSSVDPTEMSFYQLKTKGTGNWNLNAMLRRRKGASGELPSMLGKLYGCKLSFPEHTISLNFVSNASFKVELKDTKQKSIDKRTICLSDLSSKEVQKVVSELKKEHGVTDDPSLIDITFLHVSDLILNDRETYVKGKLSDFMESLNPDGKFKISLVYTTIFDEIKRKNNYENELSDFNDLVKHKAVSRSYFQTILKNFNVDNTIEEMWELSHANLSKELPPLVVAQLRIAWRKHEIERMDGTNQVLRSMRDTINALVVPYRLDMSISNLHSQVLEPVYQEYKKKHPSGIYSEYYVKAVILMEYYGV